MNKRNKIFLGMALAAAMLPMAACTDDVPQTVRLNIATEGSNSKLLFNNRYTYFQLGDGIAINDQQYTLANDGNGGKHWADVQLPINGNSFVAFFPRTFQSHDIGTYTASSTEDGHITKTVQVNFPRVYNCNIFSYDGEAGVDIPMVALAKTTDNQLYFRHAGAVIGLTINSDLPSSGYNALRVDSISVYGTGCKLSGPRDVTITDGESGTISVANAVNPTLGNYHVSCHFGNSGSPGIYPSGNTNGRPSAITIPIPVAPSNNPGALTFTVYAKWQHYNGSQWEWVPVVKYFSSHVNALARNRYYTRSITITVDGNTDPDPNPDPNPNPNPDPGESHLSIEDHTPWGNLW